MKNILMMLSTLFLSFEDKMTNTELLIEEKGISKRCNKCLQDRLLVLYCRNKNGKHGLNWICNKCRDEYRKNKVRDKAQCICGRIVYNDYLVKHMLTSLHKRSLEEVASSL